MKGRKQSTPEQRIKAIQKYFWAMRAMLNERIKKLEIKMKIVNKTDFNKFTSDIQHLQQQIEDLRNSLANFLEGK